MFNAATENIYHPFLNATVYRLMSWFYSGSNQKSVAELDRLVKEGERGRIGPLEWWTIRASISKETDGMKNLPRKFPERRPCISTSSNRSTRVARTWTTCISLSTAFSVLNECSALRWIRWHIRWWWMGWERYWISVNWLKLSILPCIASRRVTSSSSSEPDTYCWLLSMCSGSNTCFAVVCRISAQDKLHTGSNEPDNSPMVKVQIRVRYWMSRWCDIQMSWHRLLTLAL